MTTLDRRDLRRAKGIVAAWIEDSRPDGGLVPKIAAALKREREETGFGAMKWFLFSDQKEKARARVQLAAKMAAFKAKKVNR